MSLAVQLDDGTLVRLRHPGEEYDLTAAGFTWKQAQDEARLVRCEHLICQRCGGLYEVRSRAAPAGCLSIATGAVAGAVTLLVVLWMTDRFLRSRGHGPGVVPVLMSLALIGGAAAISWLVHRWQSRAHYCNRPARPPLEDKRCCEAATPDRLIALDSATWRRRPFPCSGCGGQTVTVRASGIS